MTTKAVLVIEMPKTCGECRCSYDGLYCQLIDEPNDSVIGGYAWRKTKRNKKPSWCPIRPLPEKYQDSNEYDVKPLANFDDYLELGCKMGWDACIDKITGETE